ncbi:hypothetical protein Dimus_009101 [Dionaea muscipula]
MGDRSRSSDWTKNSKLSMTGTTSGVSKILSVPKASLERNFNCIAPQNHVAYGSGIAGDAALFVLKVAALEALRRFSRARCPLVWRGVQGLQVVCSPPFKWIQRWFPFRSFIMGIQTFSGPFLFLSLATALFDQPAQTNPTNDLNDSLSSPGRDSESSSVDSSVNTRSCNESVDHPPTETWLLNLFKELENQGIILPERITENELQRFYEAANGDFSSTLAAVKKTICWRETYCILSERELELWSHMIFWHGYDVKHRPCLVVRLGLAISLPARERPQFAQAIVSQMEYGILHLVEEANPQIAVLLDCERLTPLRLPLQMMRSCSVLLQDHFPNRLGCLLVIRLPPIVRVMAQTFIQILKPVTRQKLKFLDERYCDILSEHLQVAPAYLGGKCSCSTCLGISFHDTQAPRTLAMVSDRDPNADVSDYEDLPAVDPHSQIDVNVAHNFDQVVRTAVMAVLVMCVFVSFIAVVFDPESRLFPLS